MNIAFSFQKRTLLLLLIMIRLGNMLKYFFITAFIASCERIRLKMIML